MLKAITFAALLEKTSRIESELRSIHQALLSESLPLTDIDRLIETTTTIYHDSLELRNVVYSAAILSPMQHRAIIKRTAVLSQNADCMLAFVERFMDCELELADDVLDEAKSALDNSTIFD